MLPCRNLILGNYSTQNTHGDLRTKHIKNNHKSYYCDYIMSATPTRTHAHARTRTHTRARTRTHTYFQLFKVTEKILTYRYFELYITYNALVYCVCLWIIYYHWLICTCIYRWNIPKRNHTVHCRSRKMLL